MIARKIYGLLIFACLIVSVVFSLKSFEIDGIKYIFSEPVRKNWYQALRYCRQKGMYLLDFESKEEQNKMRQYLIDHSDDIRTNSLWIAGTSLGTMGGEFFWFTNGADVDIDGFQPGQPDSKGGNEHCLEMRRPYDFQWNDINCDRPLHFICRETKYFNLIPQNK